MLLDNFRYKLRQEVELWLEEGLIDASQYEQIAERYQFDSVHMFARNRFVFILVALGSILLGLGVITFVAANWQAWSKEVKLTLLLCLFFAANIVGFFLWRKPSKYSITLNKLQGGQQLLGEGLLITGALILGANMAFMAQIFHISGSLCELFLAWGIGVLLMSYSLGLSSLGVLAIILIQLGYWTGLSNVHELEFTWGHLLVQHMPLFAWVLFIPLAYICRSSWIFVLGAIAMITSIHLNINLLDGLNSSYLFRLLASLVFVLPPALLWSYDDLAFGKLTSRQFQPLARTLTLIYFSILFYIFSFHWWWNSTDNYHYQDIASSLNQFPLIDIAILSIFTLWQWWNLLSKKYDGQRIDLTTVVMIGFMMITTVLIFAHKNITPFPEIAIFIFNLFLAILACGLIRQALELGVRQAFWGGMILLILQITSRMLEYNTGLVFKSLVFVLCGITVIIAGLWFERHFQVKTKS